MRSLPLFAALSLFVFHLAPQGSAQNDRTEARKYSPEIAGAQVETFRKVGERELKIWIFRGFVNLTYACEIWNLSLICFLIKPFRVSINTNFHGGINKNLKELTVIK